MRYKSTCLSMVAAGIAATVCFGGIPLPDTVLYGWVYIDEQLQGADDDVSVIARVDVDRPPFGNFPAPEDSVGQVVGRYDLGGSANASDRHVLRIRLESLADGNTQSNTGLSL